MKKQDYQNTITTNISSQEAIEKISHISEWWAKDFEGKSDKVNDTFAVRFKSGDRYTCKVSEVIPDKKIVWNVIDAYQGWNSHPTEWMGTKIVWEVSAKNDVSKITMTHQGLVPNFECFTTCRQGWDYLTKKSLQKLLDENEGMPV